MPEKVYRQLCDTMAKRGGTFPGMDIPEFYELATALFTPEEAAVNNALPPGLNPPHVIAAALGQQEELVAHLLEKMADKGLLFSLKKDGRTRYSPLPSNSACAATWHLSTAAEIKFNQTLFF